METDKLTGNQYIRGSLSILQEFYLEFFGTLIPGIVVVTATVLLVFGFYYCVTGDFELIKGIYCATSRNFIGIVVFFTISYMMGAIAYRRNPKIPDAISAYAQWKAAESCQFREASERLSIRFEKKSIKPQCICAWLKFVFNRARWIFEHAMENIDYPYPFMRRYLLCRGLNHLAIYVPWCAGAEGEPNGLCSKHYANIIKHRIRNSGRTNLILDMIRNESHVRMLGSHWYILTFIERLIVIAFILAIVFFLVKFCVIGPNLVDPKTIGSSWLDYVIAMGKSIVDGVSVESNITDATVRNAIFRYGWLFVSLLLAFFLIKYCRRIIELGVHYVRTREVVMILESAWVLDNVAPNGDSIRKSADETLFATLLNDARRFESRACGKCKFRETCYKCLNDKVSETLQGQECNSKQLPQ